MTEQQLARIAKSIASDKSHRGSVINEFAIKAGQMGFDTAEVLPILDAMNAEELAWLQVSPLNLIGRIKHLKRVA